MVRSKQKTTVPKLGKIHMKSGLFDQRMSVLRFPRVNIAIIIWTIMPWGRSLIPVPFWKCWPLSDSRGRCSCSCCSARLRRLARPVKQTSDQLTLTTRSHVSVSDSASHSPARPTAGGASSLRGGRARQRGWIHWAGWARYTDIQTQRMNFGARLKQADATFFSVEAKAERCCVLSAVTQLMDFHINNQ